MIKELRIGNYLKAPLGELARVKQLGSLDYPDFIKCDLLNEKGEVNGFGQNGFEPIQLTPKILLAAGFGLSEFQNRMVITYENNKFDIWLYYYKEKCIYSSSCFPDGAKPINYLHQLQNLYFALTGTELEIDITKI